MATSFSGNLGSLFRRGILTDMVLVVEGQEIPAHRAILAAQSPYFEGMFTSPMAEAIQSRVELHEPFRYEPLFQIITFLYQQSFDGSLTFELMWEVFLLAEFLSLNFLQDHVVKFHLEPGLTLSNALEILTEAHKKLPLEGIGDSAWSQLFRVSFDFVSMHLVEFTCSQQEDCLSMQSGLLVALVRKYCARELLSEDNLGMLVQFLLKWSKLGTLGELLESSKKWDFLNKTHEQVLEFWTIPNWVGALNEEQVPGFTVRSSSMRFRFKLKRLNESEVAMVQELQPGDGQRALYGCAKTEFTIWNRRPRCWSHHSKKVSFIDRPFDQNSSFGGDLRGVGSRCSSRSKQSPLGTPQSPGQTGPDNDDDAITMAEDLCWCEFNNSWYEVVCLPQSPAQNIVADNVLYIRVVVLENPIGSALLSYITMQFSNLWEQERIIMKLETTERECLINVQCSQDGGKVVLRVLCDIAEEQKRIPHSIFDQDVLERCLHNIDLNDVLTATLRHPILTQDTLFVRALKNMIEHRTRRGQLTVDEVMQWIIGSGASQMRALREECDSLRHENERLQQQVMRPTSARTTAEMVVEEVVCGSRSSSVVQSAPPTPG
mmetsp:Transcript_21484/g.47181  ORF Transcript_21484/g.47181 Transcript_21484/m.47181 type:complete len:602 (+) Transcript_21484:51-1856(+)